MSTKPLPPLESFAEENRESVRALRSPESKIRLWALEELSGQVDDELAGELLRLVTGDGDEQVRAVAAIALGPTLEMCEQELDSEGLLTVAEEIYSFAPLTTECYRAVQKTLRQTYANAAVPVLVRRRVLEASVRSPQEWHEHTVRAAWASDDESWKVTALFCMGYLFTVDFAEEIAAALRSSSRLLLAEAVGAIGSRDMVEHAGTVAEIALGEGNDLSLRLDAIAALALLSDDDAEQTLVELVEDTDWQIAESAEAALEERRLLSGQLPDEDDEIEWGDSDELL